MSEEQRGLRFGWSALALWATFGLALETAHGFKLGLYLDDNLRHTLLRLAHAHGVVLALVVLAFGRGAAALYGERRCPPNRTSPGLPEGHWPSQKPTGYAVGEASFRRLRCSDDSKCSSR